MKANPLEVEIVGFKSVKRARFELGRVTVLVGPPAGGKSNILEALEVVGYAVKTAVEAGGGVYDSPDEVGHVGAYVRANRCFDLVYGFGVETAGFKVKVGGVSVEGRCLEPYALDLKLGVEAAGREVAVARVRAPVYALPALDRGEVGDVVLSRPEDALVVGLLLAFYDYVKREAKPTVKVEVEYPSKPGRAEGLPQEPWGGGVEILAPRLYGFDRMGVTRTIMAGLVDRVRPPHYLDELARNLGSLLYAHNDVADEINGILHGAGVGLSVMPLSNRKLTFLDGGRDVGSVGVSDSILRMVYGVTALAAARPFTVRCPPRSGEKEEGSGLQCSVESLVMLEEPESHMYPLVLAGFVDAVKRYSERTRVVITTHSVELVEHIVEKFRPDDLRVYYVYREPGGPTRLYSVDVEALADQGYLPGDVITQPHPIIEELAEEGVLRAVND